MLSAASAEAAAALPYPPDAPDDVQATAARCGRVAAIVDRLADDLTHDRWLLHGSWNGPAATACGAEMSAATRLVRSLTEPLHRSGGAVPPARCESPAGCRGSSAGAIATGWTTAVSVIVSVRCHSTSNLLGHWTGRRRRITRVRSPTGATSGSADCPG